MQELHYAAAIARSRTTVVMDLDVDRVLLIRHRALSGNSYDFSQRNLPDVALLGLLVPTLFTPGIATCSSFSCTSVAGTR